MRRSALPHRRHRATRRALTSVTRKIGPARPAPPEKSPAPAKVSLVRRVNLTRRVPKKRRISLRKRPAQQPGKWKAFAPTPEDRPGPVTRVVRAIGRGVFHEYTLASLGSLLLAVIMTWPTMRHPTRTIPQDLGDPLLQAWQLAWSGHALDTDPGSIWNSNTFFPEKLSFAFSDTLLGFAPLGLLGTGVSAAILRYNIVFTLAFALAFFGAYALVRQLGAVRSGAVVAAAAFAYAPWRWGQAGHLHVLSSGGIVLALAMLARGHGFSFRHGYRPADARPAWALGGWLVAAWQVSLGFGIGLPFAYVLALLALIAAIAWLAAPRRRTPGLAPVPEKVAAVTAPGAQALPAAGAGPDTHPGPELPPAASPYARPVPDTSPYARPVSDTSPYARPVSDASPDARPVSDTSPYAPPAAEVSPYARPVSDTSPYARPGTVTQPVGDAPAGSPPATESQPAGTASTPPGSGTASTPPGSGTASQPAASSTANPPAASSTANPPAASGPANPPAASGPANPPAATGPANPPPSTATRPSGTSGASRPTNNPPARKGAAATSEPEIAVIDFGPVRAEPSQPARPPRPAGPLGRWLARRPPFPRRLFGADVLGGLVFAAVGALMAIPYLRVVEQHPYARRGVAELDIYSPPAYGFVTAPAESWLWGHGHSGLRATMTAPNEAALLIGFVLLGLALAGLLYSVWSYQIRFTLLVGMVVSTVLAMGTAAPFGGDFTYLPLHQWLPGWDGIRTPGRLVLWTTLFAGILAAGAVSAFAERAREFSIERGFGPYPGPILRLALLLPVALVLVEGISASQHPEVPRPPAGLSQAEPPLLVLPSDQLSDEMIMLWSTDGFPAVVNGGSGFTPARLDVVREVAVGFPDAASIRLLQDLGVRTVVVVKSMVAGTPYEAAANPDTFGLEIEVEDTPELVIYHLEPVAG